MAKTPNKRIVTKYIPGGIWDIEANQKIFEASIDFDKKVGALSRGKNNKELTEAQEHAEEMNAIFEQNRYYTLKSQGGYRVKERLLELYQESGSALVLATQFSTNKGISIVAKSTGRVFDGVPLDNILSPSVPDYNDSTQEREYCDVFSIHLTGHVKPGPKYCCIAWEVKTRGKYKADSRAKWVLSDIHFPNMEDQKTIKPGLPFSSFGTRCLEVLKRFGRIGRWVSSLIKRLTARRLVFQCEFCKEGVQYLFSKKTKKKHIQLRERKKHDSNMQKQVAQYLNVSPEEVEIVHGIIYVFYMCAFYSGKDKILQHFQKKAQRQKTKYDIQRVMLSLACTKADLDSDPGAPKAYKELDLKEDEAMPIPRIYEV